MKRQVAVTGLGVVSSIGADVEEFWHACLCGKTRAEAIPERWLAYADFTSRVWSPLPEPDYSAFGIDRIERMQHDPTALLAMVTAFQALAAAGLTCELRDEKRNTYRVQGIDPARAGIVLGTGIGGVRSLLSNFLFQALSRSKETLREIREGLHDAQASGALDACLERMRVPGRFNPFAVPMAMPNACSSALSIKLSLVGPHHTCCAACASGTVAIGQGYRAVASGSSDLVLAGGVEYLDDDYGGIFRGFDIARTLSRESDPERASRPFDRGRSGFLFAQGGAAVLVLEEAEHARRRGAPVLAEVAGFAETSDAFNAMLMEPAGEQIARTLADAIADAGLQPEEIDYVNAHGTGTLANDEIESAVLERMFGTRPLVNSTKSLLGHTLGASGALEAVVTVLSLQRKTTHACRNLDEPISGLNFVRRVEHHPLRAALSQSFAFGGHNAALVFRDSL
jgi:3-oxoacyl-[acyl-carrier-protein] synthase II